MFLLKVVFKTVGIKDRENILHKKYLYLPPLLVFRTSAKRIYFEHHTWLWTQAILVE